MRNYACNIILVILITMSRCEANIFSVIEGKSAELNFQYPCDCTKVTLQYANRVPFYTSANPEDLLLPSNQKLTNENETGVCSLRLTIDPVHRSDEGTYILTAYKSGQYMDDTRVRIEVDYPPGKASCVASDDYNDEDWVSLQCIAPTGTLPGQIVCYQNGLRLPPFTIPDQTDDSMIQTILHVARLEDIVFCCSSSSEQIKSECECDDCAWNPAQKSALTEMIDPCPTEISSSTHNPGSSNPHKEDVRMNSCNSTMTTSMPASIICTCNNIDVLDSLHLLSVAIVILILTGIILNICHFCKTWKIEKVRNLSEMNTSNILRNLKALVTERDEEM